MKLAEMALSAILKKGIFWDAKNAVFEFDVQGTKVKCTIEHMTARLSQKEEEQNG